MWHRPDWFFATLDGILLGAAAIVIALLIFG